MLHGNLSITVIQPDIVWEDKAANLQQYEQYISQTDCSRQVVVLPEMFSTGFSMAAEKLAEPMDGPTVQWMQEIATTYKCILTGSLIIEDDGSYYNRMLWVTPDGNIGYYDKRHLFGFAGEDKVYTAGNRRQYVSVNGWVVNLQVCYDLRFPVWARNGNGHDYDVLLYVANWPQQRSLAWKALLQARAIENQCYVVGGNRVGTDAKNNRYSGDSSVYGPLGQLIWHAAEAACVHTVVLQQEVLQQARAGFPFLKDSDRFVLL
jgi:omega-amidase